MIRAEFHSDDMRGTARFDASPWFEQASDDEILKLARIDFGGDYEADGVAIHLRTEPGYEPLELAFGRGLKGYEVNVHAPDAWAWIRENRPDLHAAMSIDGGLTAYGEGAHREPHWDSDPAWDGLYAATPGPVGPVA